MKKFFKDLSLTLEMFSSINFEEKLIALVMSLSRINPAITVKECSCYQYESHRQTYNP